MGIYLNPGYHGFEEIRRDIYVDKTGLITYMNDLIGKPKPLVSFSRPRRFGKSFDANMLCAYYDKSCDSRFLFEDLEIAGQDSFETHLNQYNVISFDVTGFVADAKENGENVITVIRSSILKELQEEFSDCVDPKENSLGKVLYSIVTKGHGMFVFVIDEWDALFREFKEDKQLQKDYILFLRSLFKNKDLTSKTIAAAYMTGILPIKKYGTESALSDFKEFSMADPLLLSEYVGFTEEDVKRLCSEFRVDFAEMKQWYDGYTFEDAESVYSPNSVISAIKFRRFRNYWTKTETFESLRSYIDENFDGLKDAIIMMLGGQRVKIDVSTFKNDLTSFGNRDDVLTLLIHLGYLAYDLISEEVYIPNREVAEVFRSAAKGGKWCRVEQAIDQSEKLLDATIGCDSETVAEMLELVHEECTSVLTYNDENSLACAIYIAYYTARNYYMIIREFPSGGNAPSHSFGGKSELPTESLRDGAAPGKGFADYAFIPYRNTDKPAMVIELKFDKNADTAIRQIHDNRYAGQLKEYTGELLLVGINYEKEAKGAKGAGAKKHSCVIEQFGR